MLNWRATWIENLGASCICVCSASRSVSLLEEDLLIILHEILSLGHWLSIIYGFSN